MTKHLEHTQKTKELIDGLKTICSNYGLANTGYEYKIITEVFLYKFLNDKFLHEARNATKELRNSKNIEQDIQKMSKGDYEYMLEKIGERSAKLKKTHFISYLFNKQNEKDLEELWRDIKAEADLQDETQIRHQFNEVFNSCEALNISFEYQDYVISILKSIKYNNGIDEMLYFAQLRKIIELLFRKTEKAGLLHSSCIKKGEVNLSESSLFLSGHPTKYSNVKCIKSHFPTIIAENVKNIIFITGAAVHTEDENVKQAKVSIEDLRKTNKTPFLIYSLVFQLMDIINWVKKYIDENPDKEKNQLLWETTSISVLEGEWIQGEITRIADNGYGTFHPATGGKTLSVIPAKVKEFNLCTTQKIQVTTKIENTGKTLIENIRVL